MATNANDTSFDLSNLTTTVEDIEIETKELDNELVAFQTDLELKETELNKLTASNETLARKRAKIKAALWEIKGPSKEKLAFENNEKTQELKAQTEEIAKAEVELRKQEALAEMWQNRKFDLVEYQRQKLTDIEDQIHSGPLGLKLLDLEKQIKELQAEENDKSFQVMTDKADDLVKEATSLSEQGKIMEQESIVMRKEIAKSEKELSDLKSATRLIESRAAAKKIRLSKLNKNE